MREQVDCDASSSIANQRSETVPTEGQEPSSKVTLDRLRYHATYYKATRKARQQDEQNKRKQAHAKLLGLLHTAANATPTHM
jgi:hypothetical protein